jgi:hypothetical protein
VVIDRFVEKTSAKLDFPTLSSLCKVHRGLRATPLRIGDEAVVDGPEGVWKRSVSRQGEKPLYDAAAPAASDCGDEEIRTPDPLLAKEVLFQLSYIPAGSPTMPGVG